jgi:hypothetical protein
VTTELIVVVLAGVAAFWTYAIVRSGDVRRFR